MYIVPSVLCFTRQSCTSCTLSLLFVYSIKKRCQCTWSTAVCSEAYQRGDKVHEVELCLVKHKTEVHCHLFFYVSLHTAVLHVHCHFLFIFHYTQLYFMYIVTSLRWQCTWSTAVCSKTLKKRWQCTWSRALCVVKHTKEVTTYMKYSCV
jgi:hypothetical protein